MNRYLGVLVGIVIGALAAMAWVVTAQEEESTTQAAGEGRWDELEKVKGQWRETWVLPGADFTRFNKVYLWEPEFQYRDVGPARRTRSTMLHSHKREFGILEEDKVKFEDAIQTAFMKEMGKGKRFTLVDSTNDIDTATLILRGAFLDIVSRVPPEFVGRGDVYLSSVGEATFAMELMDAGTGVPLAVVAERRAIQPPGGNLNDFSMPANSVTVLADVRRWANSAASKLRRALDDAIAGKA